MSSKFSINFFFRNGLSTLELAYNFFLFLAVFTLGPHCSSGLRYFVYSSEIQAARTIAGLQSLREQATFVVPAPSRTHTQAWAMAGRLHYRNNWEIWTRCLIIHKSVFHNKQETSLGTHRVSDRGLHEASL